MSIIFPRSQQIRGLIDCDSFFASCEVYANPKLAGRPVCVGKQIVLAATYEAKAYGVKTGTPVREAKKILPKDAVFTNVNFLLYGTISNQLIAFLRQHSHDVWPASIDECFVDFTHQALGEENYKEYAERLKHEIKRKIGIPVSIGIAKTKLLAKLGASKNKPFGTCVMLEEETIQNILEHTALKEISFIGRKTAPKLAYLCRHAEDFRQLDYWRIKQLLGMSGVKLRGEMNGYATNIRHRLDHQKGISRTRSFDPDFTNNKSLLRARLVGNFEKAYTQLFKHRLQAKGCKVMLRTRGFQRLKAKKTLPLYSNNKDTLLRTMKELFEQVYDSRESYRSTGIYFWELTEQRSMAQSLFDTDNSPQRNHKLQEAIQSINKKRNRPIVRAASAEIKERKPGLQILEGE